MSVPTKEQKENPMANMKPFQVIVTLKIGPEQYIKKEYGFNTNQERRIYLWGIRDGTGRALIDIQKTDKT